MKLTPELIENSRQFVNAVKERELDLRGNKIPAIENLGATGNQFDTIDLTDNDLKRLENFPNLYRLKCLLLSNNRISYIDPELGTYIPNVKTIVLTNNMLRELGDIDGLATLKSLEYLSLLSNPLTHLSQYRLYVIYKMPSVRVLDFKRVTLKERQAAIKLFKGKKGEASREKYVKTSKTFTVGEMPDDSSVALRPQNGNVRSAEELKAIQMAILNAKSLDDINRLQEMLQSGSFEIGKSITNGVAASAKAMIDVEMDE